MPDRTRGSAGRSAGVCWDMAAIVPAAAGGTDTGLPTGTMSGMPYAHSTFPTLTDGVVVLRAPTDDDIDGSVEQCQDPVSQRWTDVPVPYTRDDALRYLRDLIPGGW